MAASKPETVDFCSLSIPNRIAVADDGKEYRICEMWDEFGQDTEDDDDAAYLLVEMSEDWRVLIDMSEFEESPLN